MNITMLTLAVALCLCLADGAPDGRVARKQQRPTRGFKNMEMMTARGFGKRARTERDVEHQPPSGRTNRGIPTFKSPSVGIARDFGKRISEMEMEVAGLDSFWENLDNTQDKDGQESGEKTLESIPLDWFVNELVNNPDFARSVVRKFVDLNQDGMLSSDELLRNI